MEQRRLISIPPIEKNIPQEVYEKLEDAIWADINKTPNPEGAMEPYIYPFENIQKIADSDKVEYKENVRDMADDIWNKDAWLDAVIVYYILMHIITFLPTDFYKMGYALAKLNHNDLGEPLIKVYEQLSPNKKVMYHAVGNYYYCASNTPYKAIEYFENYIKLDNTKPNMFVSLGHLYGQMNDEVSKEKQLKAYKKAYELAPDNGTVIKSLLTAYEKMHDIDKVKELYPKLIEVMPSPNHSLNYGLYLMSWGKMQEGYKYFVDRFDIDEYPIGYPKGILNGSNRWNCKDDISNKTLILHYEEGFGDSIMYGRFIPLIKQYAGHTVFIVQPQLEKLFKQSKTVSEGVEIHTDIKNYIQAHRGKPFVHLPLMDTPYPLGVDTHFIPYSMGYLTADKPSQFDNNKINIGIAYAGDATANYNGRDIKVEEFLRIPALSDKIQLYSLQVGEASEQLKTLPNGGNIIDLGKTFSDFTDTANAVAGLDLVITSDNVILNLAGALGKRTYGIFNKYPNYRWFNLTGDNVVWYDSVKPFQCDNENDWNSAFTKMEESFKQEFLK